MYADALYFLDPTYQFVSSGSDYDNIDWYDEREKPSKETLEAAYQQFLKHKKSQEYASKRFDLYPSWRVLADAIYHQQKGDSSKMEEYIRLCDNVKQMHPKG